MTNKWKHKLQTDRQADRQNTPNILSLSSLLPLPTTTTTTTTTLRAWWGVGQEKRVRAGPIIVIVGMEVGFLRVVRTRKVWSLLERGKLGGAGDVLGSVRRDEEEDKLRMERVSGGGFEV
ncbi:hypothetical protein E2C01_091466 [Portunus trituberculatus]|uniref:Uncharacterized protein n=1 Tax=Portunus trituberculatus TaxID=210409 RepID=A0A5B7JJ49_PORTR|nr:hypothetical protein [Portunus trituberculatus]